MNPDAQQMVIDSLRLQVQDLFSQVNELNNKLVKSYDRVSDLEDDLHVASESHRSSTLKITELESERAQHLAALNTGLLVEKSHVTTELTRLMEKATEEAAHRGEAESARQAIEKDLDDLSANLFGQANNMVAEARFARHQSEQKVDVAENALKGAEEAVAAMQLQIQALRTEKEDAEKKLEESRASMDTGVGRAKGRRSSKTPSIKLLNSHAPYQEFLLFIAHLRSVHSSSPQQAPSIATLLPLPFLARLINEDSEPTVRLDLAPSLNWLSRRSVLAAIHAGQLTVEPMASMTLLLEITSSTSSTNTGNVSCALCGTSIFSSSPTSSNGTSLFIPPAIAQSTSGSSTWSASLFRKSSTTYSVSTNTSAPSTPRQTSLSPLSPSQVFVFKLATPSSGMSSIPIPSISRTSASPALSSPSPSHAHTDNHTHTPSPNPPSSTIYPLCASNWCLSRLRATCSLWAFVRTGIVEKVWEEELPTLSTLTTPTAEKPPVPPRRRGLWSMASALGERATSWGEGDKKDKAKKAQAAADSPPPPPPQRSPERRRLPPALPPKASTAGVPPPLPKRSEVRHATATPPHAESPEGTAASGTEITDSSKHADATSADIASAPSATQEPKLPPRPPRRAVNPASVPLPESRPHTPPVANAAAAGPGTPAPPPLPRRAAGRVPRPAADKTTAVPSPVEPNTTQDVESEKKQSEPEGEAVVDSVTTETTVTDVKEEGETAADSEPTKKMADEKPKENETTVVSPSVEEEEFVDAESGSEADKKDSTPLKQVAEAILKADMPSESTEEKLEEHLKDVDQEEGQSEKIATEQTEEVAEENKEGEKDEEEAVVVDAAEVEDEGNMKDDVIKTEDDSPKVETNSDEPEAVLQPDAQTVDENEAPRDEAGEASDSDRTQDDSSYVGDATWEERTWKELVRLREEMFWARLGVSKE
ncbi:hypothetical protein H0H93_008261 [Arthromyces matolae]|nr:hypothetical protein H0H93_008261 [Arthromyces matolae]